MKRIDDNLLVKRNAVIELTKHEQMMAQLKLNMEIEATDLLEKERVVFKKNFDELIAKCEADKLVRVIYFFLRNLESKKNLVIHSK